MKKFMLLSIPVLCLFISCKDTSTNTNDPTFRYETSKCISSALSIQPVLAGESTAVSDSIFSYSFSNNLILDFSAIGNCCPDSNRFILGQEIRRDTIIVTVIDTAQNLCHCNCLYMVHIEMSDLSLDTYTIRCRLGNGQTFIDPTHLVTVVRNN